MNMIVRLKFRLWLLHTHSTMKICFAKRNPAAKKFKKGKRCKKCPGRKKMA